MALYYWKGKTKDGFVREGVLEAPSKELVEVYLSRYEITPIVIKEKKTRSLFLRKRVSDKDLAIFTRQLGIMIESGIPIVKALRIIGESHKNLYFRKVIDEIRLKVEGGETLSNALKEYPKIFSKLYVNLIIAGESSGNLDRTLKRLADYIEKMANLKSKVIQAMIYPAFIILTAIGVIAIIMTFVVPKFVEMFKEAKVPLPLPTQILIQISSHFKIIVLGGFIVVTALIILLRFLKKTEKGAYTIDRLLIKIPVIGDIIYKASLIRMSETLSNLIGAGIPFIQAIQTASETAGNKVIEKALKEVARYVAAGYNIAEPMLFTGVFPALVIEMIKVAELSGNMEELLNKLVTILEEELDRLIETLSSMIEPILLVFLGVIVGGILLALYLPIFQLGSVIGTGG